MSVWFEVFCFSVDSESISQLLSAGPIPLRLALENPKSKKDRKSLELHMPWLDRILAGMAAVDPDEDEIDEDWEGDDDDGPVIESEAFLDAYMWMCEKLMTTVPSGESLKTTNMVAFEYFGLKEAIAKYPCPFPSPKISSPDYALGLIPNHELLAVRLQELSEARKQELNGILKDVADVFSNEEDDDEENEDDEIEFEKEMDEAREGFYGWMKENGMFPPDTEVPKVSAKQAMAEADKWMAERIDRDTQPPSQDEIKIAHEDFYQITQQVHQEGKDLLVIIRCCLS